MLAAHQLRRLLAAPFARRPFALQRLRWPNPFSPPYRASEINLYRPGELGDVVMCLAVVRAIRERNPQARITFVTNYTDLLAGHPLLDRVMHSQEAIQAGLHPLIALRYEVFIPLRRHVIDYLAGCVGLPGIAPQIPLPDFTADLGALAECLPRARPRIVICRNAGPFTPNKDWPAERWDELIDRLLAWAAVVELGTTVPPNKAASHHVDLRGRTNVRQFCAIISMADLVISAVTSSVHIAAAYRVPTLSILGGYELPENTAYPRHTTLYRAVSCSPCWLRKPCPYGLPCLHQIEVDEVLTAARKILQDRKGTTSD
jgi:ADP-heptose:LPS heptosyltransferase